jgi:Sulfotransferase domain
VRFYFPSETQDAGKAVRGPDFFIIGAPKCGTTSLALYLAEHPKIFLPVQEEPHFFNTDMTFRLVASESDYYQLFRDAGRQHIAVGEKSALYLYSDKAVPNILRANPNAKFLVILRNPVDMAVSFHAQLRDIGNEDIGDFATAWRIQDGRKRRRRILAFHDDPSMLLYGRVCSLGWQMKRLFSRVPRNRVLVLFQDDLKRDARSVYVRTLEFLGVPDDERTSFAVHNTRHVPVRSRLIQGGLRWVLNLNLGSGIERRLGILRMIRRLNVRDAENKAIEPELRAELTNYFRSDLEELSGLVDRDLSDWLRV